MTLFEIKAEVPLAAVERIDEALLELQNPGWTVLEDVILGQAWVVGIFPTEPEARAAWDGLRSVLPELHSASVESRALADADWRDSYKRHFRAWQFGRLHWVPIWEKEHFRLAAGESVLWLDPGLAFGTGNHETTRLCVERLVELVEQKGPVATVLDAGCGSGILALSAAKLGCRSVSGFDNDPEAVRVSIENAALNGLESDVKFSVADLISGLAGKQVDLLLANILGDVLMRHARELTAAVAHGGTLILSGILAKECEQVRETFAGFAKAWAMESRVMGEWSDVALTRPA